MILSLRFFTALLKVRFLIISIYWRLFMRNFLFAAMICCAISFSLYAEDVQTNEETKESTVEAAEAPAEGEATEEEE